MEFYAHSTKDASKADWQTLRGHLGSVGTMAAERAKWFGAEGLANVGGLLHDLGKYTVRFQKRLAYGIAGYHTGLVMISACETGAWFDGRHCKVVILRVQ